jgi:hypothetical protein
MQYSAGVRRLEAKASCVCDAAVRLAPQRKCLTLATFCARRGQKLKERRPLRRLHQRLVSRSRVHWHMCAHDTSGLHSSVVQPVSLWPLPQQLRQ